MNHQDQPPTNPALSDDRPILVIAVAYKTPALVDALVAAFLSDPVVVGAGATQCPVELVIADNSPTARPPTALNSAHGQDAVRGNVRYLHFAHNPGFSGAARASLETLRGSAEAGSGQDLGSGEGLRYRAVVLCNVDLSFACADLVAAVDDAQLRTGDLSWILAPDIVESDRQYHVNPQLMRRPAGMNRRIRDRIRRSSLAGDIAFRQLYNLRRRFRPNPNSGQLAYTQIYSAAGAFTVFGAGYFLAGGVFHEGPLFGEEFAFAEQAHALEIPVFWVPAMVVRHQGEASVSVKRNGYRQRHEWYLAADEFYRSWRPESVMGEMADWFEQARTPDSAR